MMPEGGLNLGDRASPAVGVDVSRRREEIFEAMIVAADRRRRGRRMKQVAAAALFTGAAVALTVGVLGVLPPAASAPHDGGNNGVASAEGAGSGSAHPGVPQPAKLDQAVTARVIETIVTPDTAVAAGRGVERLDASKLRRVVVAESLTDEAFAQQLAMQGDVGTARVRGRVLVLNNNPVAEEPRSVH